MPRCTPPSSSTSSTSSLAPRRSWSPSCSYSLISPFTPWAPLLPRSHLPNPPWRRSLRWSTRSSQSSRHSGPMPPTSRRRSPSTGRPRWAGTAAARYGRWPAPQARPLRRVGTVLVEWNSTTARRVPVAFDADGHEGLRF
jgi:hypothetical protein